MFKIEADRQRRMIRVETSGLGTVDEVSSFYRNLEALLRKLGWRSGEYVTMMHTLDQVVQTQVVAQTISDLMQSFPIPSRKVALVRSGALAALLTRRIMDERTSMFESVKAAETWLSTETQGKI